MLNGKHFLIGGTLVFMHGCQLWPSDDVQDLPPTAAIPASSEPGYVQLRIWTGISGSDVADLTSIEAYPNNPNSVEEITSLVNEGARGTNYGSLVKGYIEAPSSGEYTFHLAGDDETQLWLSSDESSGNIQQIASVPNYSQPQVFDKYASQTSGVQTLEGGQRYYFEIRHKQGNGGNHFAVAWEGPGLSQQIIGSEYLYSEGQSSNYDDQSAAESYSLGYRVGYFDAEQGLAFAPDFPPMDSDLDGIYDNWETVNGLDPSNSDDAASDPDGDFLTAADEFLIGTSENNADTDGDGIPDGQEFAYNLDPRDGTDAARDADGDGYSNLEEYQAGTDPNSSDEVPEEDVPDTGTGATVAGFVGQYFDGTDFDNFVSYRTDGVVDFDWGSSAPISGAPSDQFSVRWVGQFTAPHGSGSRDYEFITNTNDGVRLYLDGELVIDDWSEHPTTEFSYSRSLAAGETVPITMEYFEGSGSAEAHFTIMDQADNSEVDVLGTVITAEPGSASTLDSDEDDIPDAWEIAYGLAPFRDDATSVSNDSGVTNLQAYESGLDPYTLESTSGDTGGDEGETTEPEPPVTDVTGEVTLSWTAPSTRLDGSSIDLSEIDHYLINYGQSSGNLDQSVEVSSADTSYTFEGLDSGTWYFTVQTVDSDGLTSPESDEVSQTVE
ncbi:PA14 domain-containing protein [Marinobacter bohaiensis]|uniref:PA14 domain-containing protein n=1 Tax=Marinobacter bohaiensis TaxID=2201898 RepID=UPI000DAE9A55|nr:PA14 domain-containing protein [Marinobacter bohaiensis]